ncbi:hypothetical protein S245_054841, partial [Arachis hypogaea]
RVPVTEKLGRVHTSAVSVAILPQADENKAKALTKALKVVCAKLFEMERIGSGDRSERIRTYNFPQGRVTDHRVGITYHSIDDVMHAENLEVFIDALLLQEEMDAIATFSSSQ